MCQFRPGVDLEQVQATVLSYLVIECSAYMLSGSRVQSMGSQAVEVFSGPGMPAVTRMPLVLGYG
jgi:hypothetical protein